MRYTRYFADPDPGDGAELNEETRTVILHAAAHAFSTKGLAGMRLTDVAEYTDIPLNAIYPYYPSREDLLEEVMFRGTIEVYNRVKTTLDALPAGTTPMDRLMAAVDAHLRQILGLPDYCLAWIRNRGQVPGGLSKRQKKMETSYAQLWRMLLDDAGAGGQLLPEFDIQVARTLVLGAMNGAAEWWDPRRGSPDVLVATTQLLVRGGLTAATRPSG